MKNLLVFDFETTDTDEVKGRVCELGYVLFGENGRVKIKDSRLVDPGVDIPEEVSKIHGIYDEHVENSQTWKYESMMFIGVMCEAKSRKDTWIAAYNGGFDVAFFNAENKRNEVGFALDHRVVVDPLPFIREQFPFMRSKKLANAYSSICKRPVPDNTHSAFVDCGMTGRIIRTLIRDEIMPSDLNDLLTVQHSYSEMQSADFENYGPMLRKRSDKITFNAGKHSGKQLSSPPTSYLDWLLGTDGLKEKARDVLGQERKRRDQRKQEIHRHEGRSANVIKSGRS